MKKRYVISLIAIVLVAVSFLAMSTMATPSDGFRVGWSEIEIAPQTKNGDRYNYTQLGLGGYGDTDLRHARTLDPLGLWANCIAATDEYGNSVLFVSIDIINSHYYLVEHARDAISLATGVPEKNIMFSASHTHSSVSVVEAVDINTSIKSIAATAIADYDAKKDHYDTMIAALATDADRDSFAGKYFKDTDSKVEYQQAKIDFWYRDVFLVEKLTELCQKAMADRKVVNKMSFGEVVVSEEAGEDLNFVRHYWGVHPTTGDYVAVGDNHDDRANIDYKTSTALTSTAKKHDGAMQLVRFDIEGRTLPVVMLKWTAHPCLVGSVNRDFPDMYYMLSGDYIAPLRYAMYKKGYDMSFFQGAAGNINAYKRGDSTYKNTYDTSGNKTYDGVGAYATELANVAAAALNNTSIMQQIKPGLIQVDVDRFAADRFDHSDNMDTALYNVAVEVRSTWLELQKKIGTTVDGKTYTNAMSRYEARDISVNTNPRKVHSVYHAGTVKSSYESKEKGTFSNTQNLTLNAVSIGAEFSMVTAPGEVFDVLYLELQRKMALDYPDKNILTVAYSNSKVGYIPASYAYDKAHGGTTDGYMDYLTKDQVFCTYETDTTPLAAGMGEEMVEHQIAMLKKQAVIADGAIANPELVYCECGGLQPEGHTCEAVLWTKWTKTNELPKTTGNYVLQNNIDLTSQQFIADNAQIRLDLNGKTVTQKSTNSEASVYTDYNGKDSTGARTLTITDTSDLRNGRIAARTGNVKWGGIIRSSYTTVRLYAGTLDASEAVSVSRLGGAAIATYRSFYMYGGTILGGKAIGFNEANYADNPTEGGAIAALGGTMYMYGGTITGGVSDFGGGIYVSADAKLNLYGDAKVTGNFGDEARTTANNIYVVEAADLIVHESFVGNCGISVPGGPVVGKALGVSEDYKTTGTITADGIETFTVIVSGTELVWEEHNANFVVYDANGNSIGEFLSFNSALDSASTDSGNIIKLVKDIAEDLTVSRTVYLDLAGYDITGDVTIADGAELYLMDSTTDDFDCSDGYGMITGIVTGTLPDYTAISKAGARYTYLQVCKATADSYEYSYHRVHLHINSMNLKAEDRGLYYGCQFAGDSMVKNSIQSYGVAFSLSAVPTKETMTNPQTYTAYSKRNFVAGLTDEGAYPNIGNGATVYDIMVTGITDRQNRLRSEMPIYGVAYIKTTSGAIAYGESVNYSLRWLVEKIDTQWTEKIANGSIKQVEIDKVLNMYNSFAIMKNWNIPNIKATATE